MIHPSELHWELFIVDGGGKGNVYPLRTLHLSIGRLDPGQTPTEAQVLIPEPTVSGIHAIIEWDDRKARYLLTHKSKTNATVINGAQVLRPEVLHAGDIIKMGRLVMELRVATPMAAEVTAEAVSPALLARSAPEPEPPKSRRPERLPVGEPQPPADFEALVADLQAPPPPPPPELEDDPKPAIDDNQAEALKVVTSAMAEVLDDEPPVAEPEASMPAEPVAELEAAAPTVIMTPEPPAPAAETLAAESEAAEPADALKVVTAAMAEVLAHEAPATEASTSTAESKAAVPTSILEPPSPAEPVAAAPEPVATAPVAEPAPPQRPLARKSPKVGRNDPCPCGSGKKYKKCCGRSSYG